jgi:modulator of FtsH protease
MMIPHYPVTKDPVFVATTFRYVLYTLTMATAGAWSAILMGVSPFNPYVNLGISLGLVLKTLWESKVKDKQDRAFKWLLTFAGYTGFSITASLAVLFTQVAAGPTILASALLITVVQTLLLTYYAFYQAHFCQHHTSVYGNFLVLGVAGLLGLGLFNLLLGLPFTYFLQSAIGVGLFSAYLIYDIHLVKTGGYRSPVEAALNIFLDIVNIFLDLVRIVFYLRTGNGSLHQHVADFLYKRLLPILFIAGCILSLGYLERGYQETPTAQLDAETDTSSTSFSAWLFGRERVPDEPEFSYAQPAKVA